MKKEKKTASLRYNEQVKTLAIDKIPSDLVSVVKAQIMDVLLKKLQISKYRTQPVFYYVLL